MNTQKHFQIIPSRKGIMSNPWWFLALSIQPVIKLGNAIHKKADTGEEEVDQVHTCRLREHGKDAYNHVKGIKFLWKNSDQNRLRYL